MKKHTITVQQAKEYEFSHLMAATHGKGESKALRAVVQNGRVEYEVISHSETVMLTTDIEAAVREYNEEGVRHD